MLRAGIEQLSDHASCLVHNAAATVIIDLLLHVNAHICLQRERAPKLIGVNSYLSNNDA